MLPVCQELRPARANSSAPLRAADSLSDGHRSTACRWYAKNRAAAGRGKDDRARAPPTAPPCVRGIAKDLQRPTVRNYLLHLAIGKKCDLAPIRRPERIVSAA